MHTATSTGERKARRHRGLVGVEETRQAHLLAGLLAPYLPDSRTKGPGLPFGWRPENADLWALVELQLQRVSERPPELREAVEQATAAAGDEECRKAHDGVVEALGQALLERDGARRSLWALVEEAGGPPQQTRTGCDTLQVRDSCHPPACFRG